MTTLPKAGRRNKASIAVAFTFILTLLWLIGNFITPYLANPGEIDLGDEGVVGARDFTRTISSIDSPVARFFYDAGDVNCHQKASRSFFLNENQMPFCARDTAIFFGLAVGVFLLIFLSIELNLFWIIMGLVPMGIDGTVQLVSDSYESTNLMRSITGSIAGLVIGIALGYIIYEFSLISKERRIIKARQDESGNEKE